MPLLVLMCGLPGSGKTVAAKRLQEELPALRLSPDEWMEPLFGTLHNESERAVVEALQWEVAANALRLGLNVILENGFWSRSERDEYRARAARLGADVVVHALTPPRDELMRRLESRNREVASEALRVPASDLDKWIPMFEPPTADELGEGPIHSC